MKSKEKCPGEVVCTTDTLQGECARLGRTLEQHCHPQSCKFYYTKRGTTPILFQGLQDAVFVCRARQKAQLGFDGYALPFWAEKAYLIGNAILTQVENEYDDDDDDDSLTSKGIKKGDSGTFALIDKHLAEQGLRIREAQDWND